MRYFLLAASLILLSCSAGKKGAPTGGIPPDPARAARLLETATRIVEVGPAAQGHPSKARVQALIQRQVRDLGLEVRQFPFTADMPSVGMRWELVNLMVSFRPEAQRRILVGAHWDIRPWADEDPDPKRRNQPFDGANDGVSGVAILLELARDLSLDPPPPGVGVDLVFFDGEEGPKDTDYQCLGSRDLATRWDATGLAPPSKGAILDMVGRRGLQIRREGFSRQQAGWVLDEIFAVARERGAASFVDAPGKFILDDHIAFLQRGVPVVDLIDIDDPVWHTHGDTLDRLDPSVMAEVAEVVLSWIRSEPPP